MDHLSRRNSLTSIATSNSTTSYSNAASSPVSMRNLNTDQLLSIDQRFIKKAIKPASDHVPQRPRGAFYFPNGEVFRPRSSPSRRNRPLKLTPGPRANSLTQPPPRPANAQHQLAPHFQPRHAPELAPGPPRSYSLTSLKRPHELAHTIRSSRTDTATNLEPHYQHFYPQVVVPKQHHYYQPYQGVPPMIKSSSVVSLVHSSPGDSPRNTTTLSDSNLSSLSNYNLNRSSSNTPQTSISNSLEEEVCDNSADLSPAGSASGDNLSTLREVEEVGLNKSSSVRSNFDQMSTPIVSDSEDGDDEKEIDDDEGIVMSTPTKPRIQVSDKPSPARSARSTGSDVATKIVDSYNENSSLYSSEGSFKSVSMSPRRNVSDLIAHYDGHKTRSTSGSPVRDPSTQRLSQPKSPSLALSRSHSPSLPVAPLSPQKVFEFKTNDRIVQRLINDPEVPTRGDIQINDNHTKIIRLQTLGSSIASCETANSSPHAAPPDKRQRSSDGEKLKLDDLPELPQSAHPSPTILYSEYHEAHEVSTEVPVNKKTYDDKPLPTPVEPAESIKPLALSTTSLSNPNAKGTTTALFSGTSIPRDDTSEDKEQDKHQIMNNDKNSLKTSIGLEHAHLVHSDSDAGSSKKSKLQRKPPLHRDPSFPRVATLPKPRSDLAQPHTSETTAKPFLLKPMSPIARDAASSQDSLSSSSIETGEGAKNETLNMSCLDDVPKNNESLALSVDKTDAIIRNESNDTKPASLPQASEKTPKPKVMSYRAVMEAINSQKKSSANPSESPSLTNNKPKPVKDTRPETAPNTSTSAFKLPKTVKPAKSLPSINQNKDKEKKSKWKMFKKLTSVQTSSETTSRPSMENTDLRSMSSQNTSSSRFKKITSRSFSFGNLRQQFKKEDAPPLPEMPALIDTTHENTLDDTPDDLDSLITKDLTLTKLPTIETEENMFDDLMITFDEELQKLGRRSIYKPMTFTDIRKNNGPFLKDDELTNDQIEDQRKNDDSTTGKHERSQSDEYVDESLTFLKDELIWPLDYDIESIKSDQRLVSNMLDLVDPEEGDETSYILDKQQLINLFDSLDDQQRRRLPMHLKYIKQFKNYDKVEIKCKKFEPVLEKQITNKTHALTPIIKRKSKSKHDKKVGFSHRLFINETFSPDVYSRYNKSVTQYTLTEPSEINRMKNEVNSFKCNEMLVHEQSQHNTHFFY